MKFNLIGFLKLAAKAGPVVYAVARQVGPQVQRLMNENPEAFALLTRRFKQVTGTQGEKTPKGLTHRTTVLREQATYLYASANNSEAAKKAIAWRHELESLERAIPVLDAMSRKQRLTEKRHIERRLDAISSEILSASLIDTIEDAEIISNPQPFIHAPGDADRDDSDAETSKDAS